LNCGGPLGCLTRSALTRGLRPVTSARQAMCCSPKTLDGVREQPDQFFEMLEVPVK
jgi:hypothetical protein